MGADDAFVGGRTLRPEPLVPAPGQRLEISLGAVALVGRQPGLVLGPCLVDRGLGQMRAMAARLPDPEREIDVAEIGAERRVDVAAGEREAAPAHHREEGVVAAIGGVEPGMVDPVQAAAERQASCLAGGDCLDQSVEPAESRGEVVDHRHHDVACGDGKRAGIGGRVALRCLLRHMADAVACDREGRDDDQLVVVPAAAHQNLADRVLRVVRAQGRHQQGKARHRARH